MKRKSQPSAKATKNPLWTDVATMPMLLREWQIGMVRWGRWSQSVGGTVISCTPCLIWAESGEATYLIGPQALRMRPGVLALTPAGLVRRLRMESREPFVQCSVHFTLRLPNGLMWAPPGGGARWVIPADPREVEQRLDTVAATLGSKNLGSYFRACAAVLDLVALVIGPGSDDAPRRAGAPHGKAYEALALMQQNLSQPLSVKELAQALEITPEYLSQVFRRTFGISPKQQIFILHMHWANSLLLTTDKSVKDIAAEAGFRSSGVFTRAFQRWCGHSPAEQRGMSERTVANPLPLKRTTV